MRLLQRKKVGMSAGSGKKALLPGNLVNQQPVRFNVQLPFRLPFSSERMVFVFWRKRSLIQQDELYHFLQFFHVVTAFFNALNVLLKKGREYGLKHLYAQLPEHIIRILGVMQTFPIINRLERLSGFLIGYFQAERQTLFKSHSGQRHAAEIGYRQPHGCQYSGGFLLDGGVNAGANIVVGRNDCPPVFRKCSSIEHKVNSTLNEERGRRHGL